MGKNILIVVSALVALLVVLAVGIGVGYSYGILRAKEVKDDDNCIEDNSEITKIVYEFGDSSVPPQYHRSYVITVTKDKVHIVVDSYGDVLNDKEYKIDEKDFDSIVEALSEYDIKNRTKTEDNRGCTGGTSDGVKYYIGDTKEFDGYNYNCAGEKFGNLDGDVEGFASTVKDLIPGFEKLLD